MKEEALFIFFPQHVNLHNGESCRSEKFGVGVTDCWGGCQTSSQKSYSVFIMESTEPPDDSKVFHQFVFFSPVCVFLRSRDRVNNSGCLALQSIPSIRVPAVSSSESLEQSHMVFLPFFGLWGSMTHLSQKPNFNFLDPAHSYPPLAVGTGHAIQLCTKGRLV